VEAVPVTPFVCPKCLRRVEVCTPNAQVAHICPASKPKPAFTQFTKAEVRA
jgi:hypothetical protein